MANILFGQLSKFEDLHIIAGLALERIAASWRAWLGDHRLRD
jgi:hypothetical protein